MNHHYYENIIMRYLPAAGRTVFVDIDTASRLVKYGAGSVDPHPVTNKHVPVHIVPAMFLNVGYLRLNTHRHSANYMKMCIRGLQYEPAAIHDAAGPRRFLSK